MRLCVTLCVVVVLIQRVPACLVCLSVTSANKASIVKFKIKFLLEAWRSCSCRCCCCFCFSWPMSILQLQESQVERLNILAPISWIMRMLLNVDELGCSLFVSEIIMSKRKMSVHSFVSLYQSTNIFDLNLIAP